MDQLFLSLCSRSRSTTKSLLILWIFPTNRIIPTSVSECKVSVLFFFLLDYILMHGKEQTLCTKAFTAAHYAGWATLCCSYLWRLQLAAVAVELSSPISWQRSAWNTDSDGRWSHCRQLGSVNWPPSEWWDTRLGAEQRSETDRCQQWVQYRGDSYLLPPGLRFWGREDTSDGERKAQSGWRQRESGISSG